MKPAFFKIKPIKEQPTQIDEEVIDGVRFTVFKFTDILKPKDNKKILIICCFSEFGCETIGVQYCIPKVLQGFRGYYKIAVGWHGREYLYRHLVDEFWEIKEEFMWLREHVRAFHHHSDNLDKIEDELKNYGCMLPSVSLGLYALGNKCRTCGHKWHNTLFADKCVECHSTYLVHSVFSSTKEYKKNAARIPFPSQEMIDWAEPYTTDKMVGIFARGRKCYGRNLQPEFYIQLIEMLRDRGYDAIWLGEKQSVQPCPVDDVLDFSRMEESRDLERTLAIICNLQFTIQFWTASSRLSAMMGTPFLIIESPDQIYKLQEGFRLELTTFGPWKLGVANYMSMYENMDEGIQFIDKCVGEMEDNNYDEVIGLVHNKDVVEVLQKEYYKKLR